VRGPEKRPEKKIEFTKDETRLIVREIQRYFQVELDQEIGALPAEMLLDFFTTKIGAQFYNRGVYDAHAVVNAKLEDVAEAVLGLERSGMR